MGRKRNSKSKNEQPVGSASTPQDKLFETELLACDRSPVFGRYLKAKSDIKKGTIILKEKCLVAGPRSSALAICIGCHSYLDGNFGKYKCSKCFWPLCTMRCANSPHHGNYECKFFRERNIPPPTSAKSKEYGAISVIRALLLKIYRPKDYKMFMALQHHNDERRLEQVWTEDQVVVNVIMEQWNLKELFTEEEIHAACGIYEVNSFEMGDYNSFGGIFPIAAMICHDCVANAGHFENMDEGLLEVVAVKDIPRGEPIAMCYDFCLKGTDIRQSQLWRSKYFICNCKRCSDPSELGTNLSTVLCTNPGCKNGLVMPIKIYNSTEKNNSVNRQEVEWKCNKCSKISPNNDIRNLTRKNQEIANTLQTIKSKEEFIHLCKTIFHPNHFVPFSVKFSLCMAYGHDDGYALHELSQSDAYRKLELCQEVLKVLDILTPGYSTTRGNILYEIQAAEVLLARDLYESGKCSKALVKRRLQNSLEKLNEAIAIFELCYPLRLLAESAKTSTRTELKNFVSALK